MTEKPIFEQKCPNCGAPMKYNPTLKKLECEFCGTILDIADTTKNNKISRKERDATLQQIKPLPIYNCISCGAEVLVSEENGALTCPYCQNNIVLTKQFSGTMQPDGIIPFKITPDQISKAVQKFYKDKPLLSKKYFSESRIGKITGVYIPFWVFDCEVSGDGDYTGTRPGETFRQGDYIIKVTEHYRLERNVSMRFENLAIDASEKMKDDLMDSVCPYDMKELKPFDVAYLAGYVADRFDQTSEEMQVRSDQRVLRTADTTTILKTTHSFMGVYPEKNHMQTIIQQARYVLLPMYLFHIEYNGETYEYALNGQTGKVVGRLPEDKNEERKYYMKFFGLGFGICALLIFVLFVVGGN